MRGFLPASIDVLGVVLHVAAVEHGVLRRGDVDEGRLHAGQHVLHPADVDVAVDLADVVGRAAHVVLDQVPTLEDGDLGHARAHLHGHEVATDRLAVAFAAATRFEHRGIHGVVAAPPSRPRPRPRALGLTLAGRRVVSWPCTSAGAFGRAVGVCVVAPVGASAARSSASRAAPLRGASRTAAGRVVVGRRACEPGRGWRRGDRHRVADLAAGAPAPARRPRPTAGLRSSVRGVRRRHRRRCRSWHRDRRSSTSWSMSPSMSPSTSSRADRPGRMFGGAARRGSPDAVWRGRAVSASLPVAGRVSRRGRVRDVGRCRAGAGDRVRC